MYFEADVYFYLPGIKSRTFHAIHIYRQTHDQLVYVHCRYYNSAVTKEEILKDMSTNIQNEISSIELLDTLLLCPLFQVLFKNYYYVMLN